MPMMIFIRMLINHVLNRIIARSSRNTYLLRSQNSWWNGRYRKILVVAVEYCVLHHNRFSNTAKLSAWNPNSWIVGCISRTGSAQLLQPEGSNQPAPAGRTGPARTTQSHNFLRNLTVDKVTLPPSQRGIYDRLRTNIKPTITIVVSKQSQIRASTIC